MSPRRRAAAAGAARAAPPRRRRPGRRHGLHLPQPRAQHRPAGAVAGARSIFVGARPYAAADARAARRGARGGSPATRGSTTTRRCAPGCGTSPGGCAPTGGRPSPSPTTTRIVDREVAHRAGLGWFGKNANLLAAGRRQLVRARLRRHHGAAAGRPTPVRRRLRHVPALPRRAARPGRSSRPASSTPTAAWPGCCSSRASIAPALRARRSATGSTAATTARRSCPPTVRLGRRHRTHCDVDAAAVGRRARPARRADDADVLDRHGRWYLADRDPRWLRRNALVVLGNIGDGRRPRRRRRARPLPRHDDADAARTRRWAARRSARRARPTD